METDITTETLARLYESQGYYRDALEHYTAVNRQNPSSDIEKAVQRISRKLETSDTESGKREAVRLVEQWMHLLLLKRRLKIARKIAHAHCLFPTA